MPEHTLSVLVDNKPGVLARATALFARRGFSVASVAVGATEHPGISRITIVVDAEDRPLEQVTKQIRKLVDVLKIVELPAEAAIRRELALVKVRADADSRPQIVEIVRLFRARTLDISPDAVTVEATGTPDRIQSLVRMLEPYGIRELVQSGTVAIGRGAHRPGERPLRTPGPSPLRATA